MIRVLLAVVVALSPPAILSSAAPPAAVVFAHFNDVYEIDAIENGAAGGMARLATVLNRLRAGSLPVVTTLGGDFLSPSALGTAVVDGEPLAGRQMVDLLNAVGLQWATLGNHEFDLSEASFRKRLSEARFKVVVSNAGDAKGQPFAGTVPSAIATVRNNGRSLRIGLLGLVIDSTRKAWVTYSPPIEAARAQVNLLKGKVDAIVALTHLSLIGDQTLVEAVPEIDLVLGGHEHENWLIRRGGRFTPIVKADANVRSVAVVTMRFPSAGRPDVSVRYEVLDRKIAPHARTQSVVKRWVDTAFAAFRNDGFDPAAVVATIAEPLDGRELTVRNGPGNLTSLIADALRREANADAAIMNGGSIRIDDVLPAGQIRQYDLIRVLPFGGKVVKVTLEGALLRQILDAGLANIGTGGYLHVAGIERRDGDITVNGRPLAVSSTYTIAMPEFLMTGLENRMSFLTRKATGVRGVEEFRDIRLVLMDELKRRFSGLVVAEGRRAPGWSGRLGHRFQRETGLARQ